MKNLGTGLYMECSSVMVYEEKFTEKMMSIFEFLDFLNLSIDVFHQFWKILSHLCLWIFLLPLSLFSLSRTPINWTFCCETYLAGLLLYGFSVTELPFDFSLFFIFSFFWWNFQSSSWTQKALLFKSLSYKSNNWTPYGSDSIFCCFSLLSSISPYVFVYLVFFWLCFQHCT